MGSLSGFFTRNWTLKLSAFGIALLLWVGVRVEAPNRQEFPGVPVRVDLGDPQWTLVGEPVPGSVVVRFGGPSRELLRMAVDRPNVVIPLEQVASGDTTVVLRNQWIQVQDRPGVVVEDIQPSSVRLTLEPIERITAPAEVRLEGQVPEGFAMSAGPIVDPVEIQVRGPRSRVAELTSVPLMPVDVSDLRSSTSVPVSVDTVGLEGLQAQPRTVQVQFQIEDRVQQVISGIPIRFPVGFSNGEDFEIRPTTASVILQGARSAVQRADPTALDLVVEVQMNDLPEPGEEVEASVVLEGLPDFVTGAPQQSVVTLIRRGAGDL